jgi:hypothetical protein
MCRERRPFCLPVQDPLVSVTHVDEMVFQVTTNVYDIEMTSGHSVGETQYVQTQFQRVIKLTPRSG